jgi:thiamine pyrophosphate-dependent acetolactate synthase large subunit-like protein
VEEDLAALFCCPCNYTVLNAMAAAGVPAYGGRTEGAMCAAADGFSRVTSEVTACSGTEGPGFTHMIMNIARAHAARTPLLVLGSNM